MVQVTVVPWATVSVAGEKPKSTIVTRLAPVAVPGRAAVCRQAAGGGVPARAAGRGTVGGGGGGGSVPVGVGAETGDDTDHARVDVADVA